MHVEAHDVWLAPEQAAAQYFPILKRCQSPEDLNLPSIPTHGLGPSECREALKYGKTQAGKRVNIAKVRQLQSLG